MATHDLYHGANASKMLYNIRNNGLTADGTGRIFFAAHQRDNCFVHGADLTTKESYAAKFRVEIPPEASFAADPRQGNPDAMILTIATGASVRAELLELYVRRGRVGSFTVIVVPKADAARYLEAKLAGKNP